MHAGCELEALLLDMDRLLEMRNAATAMAWESSECTRIYSDDDMEIAGRLALKLLRFATQRGCVGLAGYVFPIAFNPPVPAEAKPSPNSLTLLHLAVRSSSLSMVRPCSCGCGTPIWLSVHTMHALLLLHGP